MDVSKGDLERARTKSIKLFPAGSECITLGMYSRTYKKKGAHGRLNVSNAELPLVDVSESVGSDTAGRSYVGLRDRMPGGVREGRMAIATVRRRRRR